MRTHPKQFQNIQRHKNRPGGGRFLTAQELAAKAGEQERTIWTLYRNGILPAYDLGRRIKRFTEADYIKAVQKRKTK
jgi:predicted DNA-binding transcriptional regulator AlpA